MSLSAKQKRKLKSLFVDLKPSATLGKDSPDENFLKVVDNALEAHELIKIKILQNSASMPDEVASFLSEKTRSEVVSVVGRVIYLYRKNKKRPKIIFEE